MTPLSCELLVVGGGVAGSCAAIAAARCGVRTLLVERQAYCGGIGYAGKLQHICGLYLNGETLPAETLHAGLTREIVGLLHQRAPLKVVQTMGQVHLLPYASTDLHELLSALFTAESALTVLCNTTVTGVEVEQGQIGSLSVAGPDGPQTISAAMTIDCSGNGDVAAMAGASFELSPDDERQLAGFVLQVSGLEPPEAALALKVPYYCALAVAEGLLPPLAKFTTFSQGDMPGDGFIKLSLEGEDTPERNQQALDTAHALFAHVGQVVPAFSHARITATSLAVMDREGRRICGEYMLTEDDVLAARKFPDAIVKGAWPIELWDRTKGTVYKYVPRGDYYEIPFRCITVKGIANLLTAGRCISVSHAALGSTRVMGTCMALGEQAGRAAAFRIRNGTYPEIVAGQQ